MRELARHREFRLLLTAQTLSMFGDWTLLLVLGIWAKTLTGSSAVAGLTVFAMAAPGVLAPLAGVVVDRLPRRSVLLGVNLVGVVVVSSLWLVHDRRQLWLLFAVAAWYGIASIVTNAATSGLVQSMLPAELLGPANGALSTVRQGLRLLGPLVGAGLFAAAGGRWVATLDATAFVLAAVVLLRLRHREQRRDPTAGRGEVLAGLVHLWRTTALRRVARSTLVFSGSVGLVEATVYALVDDGLHRPAEFVGVLVSVQGVGPSPAGWPSASSSPGSTRHGWSPWAWRWSRSGRAPGRSRPCRWCSPASSWSVRGCRCWRWGRPRRCSAAPRTRSWVGWRRATRW